MYVGVKKINLRSIEETLNKTNILTYANVFRTDYQEYLMKNTIVS